LPIKESSEKVVGPKHWQREKTSRRAPTDAEEPNYAAASPAQQEELEPAKIALPQPQQGIPTKCPMLEGHLPPHVEIALEALQCAGFRALGNVAEIGNQAWIKCLPPPADTGNAGSNYGATGRASQALRKWGFDVGPEDIEIKEVAGQVLVLVPVRLAPKRAYEPKAKMLTFRPLPGGGIGAETPYSDDALLNTRDEFVQRLQDVRVLVRKEKTISAPDLANRFADTILASAADPPRWEEWRKEFAGSQTAKNAALVLLHDTTGLMLSSLEAKLSKTRTRRKVQKTGESNHG
jgi:hypothetical protein